ncbi:hypothetical protein U4X45_24495, partial [Escherichia coli]|nr:hypothetical protein [Escherichia coli]
FEWVHVQLHQQKGMISLSPPTICNSAVAIIYLMPLFILGKEQLYVLISPIFIPALVKKMFVLFLKI